MSTMKTKIMGLIAQARGTDNEFEAEAFLNKANELMEKYQIEAHELHPEDDKVIFDEGVTFSSKSHDWMWELFRAVGKFYGCESIREDFHLEKENRRGRIEYVLHHKQTLIGRESAVATTHLMYEYMKTEVGRAARRIAPITGLSPAGQARRVGAELINRIWRVMPMPENSKAMTVKKEFALLTLDAIEAVKKQKYLSLTMASGSSRGRKTDALSRAAAMDINLDLGAHAGHKRRQIGAGS